MFASWYNKNCDDFQKNNYSDLYVAHLRKMPKTIATLALIFELIMTCGESDFIGLEAMSMACEWSPYLKSHAKFIYGELGNNDLSNAKRILAEKDKLNDLFTISHIRLKGWSGLTENKTIEEALNILVDYNYVFINNSPQTIVGRKTTKYYFNPLLKNK